MSFRLKDTITNSKLKSKLVSLSSLRCCWFFSLLWSFLFLFSFLWVRWMVQRNFLVFLLSFLLFPSCVLWRLRYGTLRAEGRDSNRCLTLTLTLSFQPLNRMSQFCSIFWKEEGRRSRRRLQWGKSENIQDWLSLGLTFSRFRAYFDGTRLFPDFGLPLLHLTSTCWGDILSIMNQVLAFNWLS